MARSRLPRAAVIGSGFGGLAVAIRLRSYGVPTTLFEARDQPGGRAYVYRDGGYTFDAGPTIITAPHCIEELFAAAGRKMEDYVDLIPVRPFYRLLWGDGTRFDWGDDLASTISQIRAIEPADVDGYLRFLEYSRQVFDVGYTELVATPFLHFRDMIRVAPDLLRLRADRSVYATVARFVRNEHVRQALSFHSLLVGGNPFETSAIYTLIHHLERRWGVSFPRGGTGALVAALTNLFLEMGGVMHLSSPVRRVRLEQRNGRTQHRVQTDGGNHEVFDLVVSNADLHHTYAHLFSGSPAANRTRQRLERMDWSMSLFILYFGTDCDYREEVAHHTVLFGPRYQGLLEDVFHGTSLPADYSLYLHAPTVTDPSLAPENCGSFYVLAPVPHLGNARLDWEKAAAPYAARVLETLERVLPNLRAHVVTQRWFTPTDFESQLHAYHGSAFSCAPRLSQSAWFRPHNRDDDIPHLYLVGAGTHPGAGVPGVINSAKATARIIAEDFAL